MRKCFAIILFCPFLAQAQETNPADGRVFTSSEIPKVHIMIDADSLEQLYEVENWYSNHEYPVTFVWQDAAGADTLHDVGFRFRGNTSRNNAKKSFKISINAFVPGRRFEGLKKLNLNAEVNDPSMIRSHSTWKMYRDHNVPASRSNHVEVYINGNYYGLYQNCENIDDDWVEHRFGDDAGNLYKCSYGANLNYISNNPNDYKLTPDWSSTRTYELSTNEETDNYKDLSDFIAFLNQSSATDLECELHEHFNVYNYLKVLAVDVLTGNWDAYLYNQNNYYLYRDPRATRFEYLPYDLDNTWGIDWLGQPWAYRSVYNFSPSWQSLPLYDRLMDSPKFRDIFSWHLREMMDQYYHSVADQQRIAELHGFISASALADDWRLLDHGYAENDFLIALDEAFGNHVAMGVFPFAEARKATATAEVEGNEIAPIIVQVEENFSEFPSSLRARVLSDGPQWTSLALEYSVDGGAIETITASGFNAQHDFLINISQGSEILSYNVIATGSNGLQREAWCQPRKIYFDDNGPKITINEVMASNGATIADPFGEYDDWLELHNAGNNAVNLTGFFLSDKHATPKYWPLPALTMDAGSFRLFWADGDTEQGLLHANFSIASEGERIYLFQQRPDGLRVVDIVDVPESAADVSWGRQQDGSLPWVNFDAPTPGASNESLTSANVHPETSPLPYPNPSSDKVQWQVNQDFVLFEISGRLLLSGNGNELDLSPFAEGVYLLQLDGRVHRLVKY